MASGVLTGRVTLSRTPANRRPDQEQDDLYAMASLFPRTTGLPMTVWVSPRGRARHAARIKVSLSPDRMDIGHTAVVGIRSSPRLIQGTLVPADLDLVSQWIRVNEDVLMDFWNETIDSTELASRLKKI
jgi:hypothetical protein